MVSREQSPRVEILASTLVTGGAERVIAALVKGATKRSLGKRPQPDRWSVTEILAHLADEELVQGFRQIVLSRRHRSALASRELASYSPLEILGRGYAVVTQVAPASAFYPAEDYHQDYFGKHPERPSCHVRVPRFDQKK